jgi:hypothetical protein
MILIEVLTNFGLMLVISSIFLGVCPNICIRSADFA